MEQVIKTLGMFRSKRRTPESWPRFFSGGGHIKAQGGNPRENASILEYFL